MSDGRTINDGEWLPQDAAEERVYTLDYDARNLPAGVQLASAGAVSVDGAGNLTYDGLQLLEGNRKVQIRIKGGTRGRYYIVRHTVTTLESPPQTKSKWFRVAIT